MATPKPTHTPGPWTYEHLDLYIFGGPDGDTICEAPEHSTGGEFEADARLIAAAPDLLTALSDLVRFRCDASFRARLCRSRENESAHEDALLAAAKAAILRATGGK